MRHEDFQAELRRRYGHRDLSDTSRASMSSIHSDMGPVADFLAKQHALHWPSAPYVLLLAYYRTAVPAQLGAACR